MHGRQATTQIVVAATIGTLRAQGASWRKIARPMGCSDKTCRRSWQRAGSESLRHAFDADRDKNLSIPLAATT